MIKKEVKCLDDLETGIKFLLLENRCSYSDEEKELLNDCLMVIQQKKKSTDIGLIVKIIEILNKLFIASDHFQDLF